MTVKILCHKHQEATPSLAVFEDGWAKCFGCGWYGRAEEAGAGDMVPKEPKYVEDVKATVERIRGLGMRRYRGFDFHGDDSYVYILWPDASYYKRRSLLTDDDGPKYKCPSGVTRPIFTARRNFPQADTCVIIEGELNALSVASVTKTCDVVSPGAASEFAVKKYLEKDLPHYKNYRRIILICDNDKAGVKGCIELKALLNRTYKMSRIDAHLMSIDANDLLVKYGKEKLKDELKKAGLEVS